MAKPIILARAKLNLIRSCFIGAVSGLLFLTAVGCGGGDDDDNSKASSGGSGATSAAVGGSGGSNSTKQTGGSGSDTSTKTTPANNLVGSFQVKLVAQDGTTPAHSAFIGMVYDGTSLEQTAWDLDTTEGDCQLFIPRTPFCDPVCGSGKTCVQEQSATKGTCQTNPNGLEVGTVTVKGVKTAAGATEFTVKPIAKNYQASESLPFSAFAEGDEISVSAAGAGSVSAFSLTAKGINPLEVLTNTITVENKDAALKWTKPTKSESSKIYIKLEIAHHGGQKGKIECNTKDTGEFTLTGSMMKKLVALGVAGFPTIVFQRTDTGSTTLSTGGSVNLVISSSVEQSVTIPGLVSCNADTKCPEGKTCQDDMTCK